MKKKTAAKPSRATTTKPVATPKLKAIKEKQTKAAIIAALVTETSLTKKQVHTVLEGLMNKVKQHMMPGGSGEFVMPGLGLKIRRVHKKAAKSRIGRNPLTGAEITIPAKPAHSVVRVSALKALKGTVEK